MIIAIDGRYIQDHFPGIGRYTYNLVAALARVAPDDAFVVLHDPALRNTRYDVAALARHPNVELRYVHVTTFSLAEQYRLPFLIRSAQSAVFHSPYYLRPYLVRVPSVVTIFDIIPLVLPDDLPGLRARLVFRVAVSLAARTATRIIVPSAATRDDLIVRLRTPRDKVFVVPLAAEARFRPQPVAEIARVREEYGLPAEYILSVGINKPHKNLAVLIQAWRQSGGSAGLVIAGAWDARYQVTAGDQVKFIQNVADADLAALYAGASLFVMPSLYEGFGLPALEAMACGAPVICSNASSLPEVVGDAALLFDPRNPDMLADLIARVSWDRASRDELRAKSLARAGQFSWERTARETVGVYRSAA